MEPMMTTVDKLDDLSDRLDQVLAHVSVLQASIDSIPAMIEAAVPDPALTLGSMDQRLTAIEAGMVALAKVPVKSAQDFERMRVDIARDAKRAAEDAARADLQAWKHQAEGEIVTRTVREQRAVWTWRCAGAGVAGFVLYGVMAATVPGGSYLSAWSTGHTDRWEAGEQLMSIANLKTWNRFVAAWNEMQRQAAAVAACKGQARLFRGDPQHSCEVVLPKAGGL